MLAAPRLRDPIWVPALPNKRGTHRRRRLPRSEAETSSPDLVTSEGRKEGKRHQEGVAFFVVVWGRGLFLSLPKGR